MKFAAGALAAGTILAAMASPLFAQDNAHEAATAAQGAAAPTPPRGVRVPSGYAAFPVDPAMVARGKTLFASSCASCHALDIRGTDNGPNLRRSTYQLNDKGNGKMVGVIVRESAGHKGQFLNLSDKDAADLTHYLKSFPPMSQGGAEIGVPARFVLGNATAGKAYFTANCASCHAVATGATSASTNLAGIGTRITDPKTLQQAWLAPRTTKVVTAAVTLKDGTRVEGPVGAPSEFVLNLTVNGAPRAINRSDAARIDMTYPLIGHAKLLDTITDTNIHDVTGYLATLK